MDYVIYFIITVAILVFIHEFGHFIAAKLSKMQVDIFSLGFGPRIVGYNKITGLTFGALPKDIDLQGATDYKICLIPLGGYVKIAGMIDESLDTEFVAKEVQPHEFRAKSTPTKLFVISAGVLMNFLLALLIFWGANFFEGKIFIKSTSIGFSSAASNPLYEAGLRNGDKILEINGAKIQYWENIVDQLFIKSIGKDAKVKLIRNEETIELTLSKDKIPLMSKNEPLIFPAEAKVKIKSLLSYSPAEKAGLKPDDIIVSINSQNIFFTSQVVSIISSNANKEIQISVLRKDELLTFLAIPNSEGKIGIELFQSLPIERVTFGFFESFGLAFADCYNYLALTINMLGKVFTGKIEFDKAFGGPIKIAQFAADSAEKGISSFLFFLALLSLSLALINILPFPALDGGHLIIISIEGIIKKELPVKVKIAIQNAGFFLLLALMAFIIYKDIVNL